MNALILGLDQRLFLGLLAIHKTKKAGVTAPAFLLVVPGVGEP
jgi:hypothetical protein